MLRLYKFTYLIALIILSSCSHIYPVKVKNESRKIASFSSISNFCNSLFNGAVSKHTHNTAGDINIEKLSENDRIREYIEESNNFHEIKDSEFTPDFSKTNIQNILLENSFVEKYEIKKILFDLLKYKKYQNIPLLELYQYAINKKIKELKTLKDIHQLINFLNDDLFPITYKKQLLSESILSSSKKSVFNFPWENESLDKMLIKFFRRNNNPIATKEQFITYLDILSSDKMRGSQILYVIKKTQYFQEEVQEKYPKLATAILDLVSENIRYDSKTMIQNISDAIKLEISQFIIDENIKINSAYLFFSFLKHNITIPNIEKILIKTDYAKRMNIKLEDINKIIKMKHTESFQAKVKEVLPIYSHDKNMNSLDIYDQEIELIGVKDQCDWGACWNYSGTTKTEIEIQNTTDEIIDLSEEYSYLSHIINEFKVSINQEKLMINNDSEDFLFEAGTLGNYYEQRTAFGIMPKESYTPKIDFNTTRDEVQAFAEKLHVELKEKINKNLSSKKRAILNRQYTKKFLVFLDELIGLPTKEFEYKGKTYTSHSFLSEKLKDPRDHFMTYALEKSYQTIEDTKFHDSVSIFKDKKVIVSKSSYQQKAVSIDEVEKRIIESIDKNHPVKATFIWDEKYINNKTGQVNITKNQMKDITPETLKKAEEDGLHAVLIIGYELDSNGRLSTLKILNSYGESNGDRGIYHVKKPFFDLKLENITLNIEDLLGFNYMSSDFPVS